MVGVLIEGEDAAPVFMPLKDSWAVNKFINGAWTMEPQAPANGDGYGLSTTLKISQAIDTDIG